MKIRGAKPFGSLALLGAAALVVSGCAAGNTGAPTQTESAGPELPATAWVRADAADVQDGGTLTLAVSSLPVQFNINQVDGNEADTVDIVEATTGGPFKIEEDGTPVVDENYASSAEVTSDDPQVVDIKLNPDAKWEDGSPITVADWIAFWEAQNGSNDAYIPASTAGWEDISSIEQGDDEFHMVITFSSVYADWQGLFTGGLLPAAISEDPAAYNDGYRTKAVPSSGPFRITDIDTTGQVVTLERNPEWWGETPKLERVLHRAVSQDQQGASFANSEIDALYISANADLYQTAQTREDAEIQTSGGTTWTHVTMNAKEGPLADVNVRKAVASVVNREQIAASANTPVGAPPITQGDYIFMPGQNGYEDKGLPVDPEAATSFLEEAGYEGSAEDGWTKDGEALELTVTVPADTATNIQRSEQVQADLEDFGIPVELVTVPAATYFSDYVIPGNFEMVSFSWVGTAFPISSSEALYYPIDSESNFTGTTDDRLGDLYDQSNAELDADARIEIAKEINDVIWDYVPMFPIAPLPNVYAVKDGLVNWGATQFETIDWANVGWAAE
ncbi:ABC transporter family substrate-binding protein [Microbacterium sp. EYE_5]|uniref:ABC transporter family substrate-binding protein n=1 Tax=unclassified Microbacterium TaxID=2609290 RepID=UPI0020046F1D|nr:MULTISPECIES: ABC transporter family substrate-binding protein [unclassified Microbacterium]MCK6081047.1 ABC transporter family substrate-binding protein [Microbacterium sp. EYE_382]MCK6086317.1 ABC transporter family substrate-binding protein [Microbacterium sp. EYE_384]MCK6124185.1 ABC transporter family substrate-binding protein [Microbacterium sp. EYE_80]MCK6127094.1 ABC transporter family substrate-binding protein [Microbacterium sp. EYE_79]MCK6142002.1 ABC transporter family substrate